MAAQLFYLPFPTAFTSNGLAVPGAQLEFYLSGTLTPAPSYTTSSLAVEREWPVVANGAGRFPSVYLDDSISYRLIIKNADGAELDDIDPYTPGIIVGSQGPAGDLSADYKVRTPYMHGAVGDGVTDDSDALQAFYDHAFDAANARQYYYDARGTFAISRTIYATYPVATATDTGIIARKGRLPTMLRIMPLAAQAGGVPMDYALVIGGPRNEWDGLCYINGFNTISNVPAYADRRLVSGVKVINCGGSKLGYFIVAGAKRDSLYFDPSSTAVTVRSGGLYEITYTSSNNIAVQVAGVQSYNSGPYHDDYNVTNSFGYTLAWSAIDHGSVSGGIGGTYTTGVAAASSDQRTRLTVPSTAELRVGDWGKVRLATEAATFTTISADNATSKFVWATGNPVIQGWQIGDKFRLIDRSVVGLNNSNTFFFEIISFGGVSNREITVYPAPTTETAKAYTRMVSAWSYHQVLEIRSATVMDVFPYIPSRSTALWHSAHGYAANVGGADTGATTIGYVGCGGGSWCVGSLGQYGLNVGSAFGESCEGGLVQGFSYGAVAYGTKIGHVHFEDVAVNILQANYNGSSSLEIGCNSSFQMERIVCNNVRTDPTYIYPIDRPLENAIINIGGRSFQAGFGLKSYSGDQSASGLTALTNDPIKRRRSIIYDGAVAVELDFDDTIAKTFPEHHWAELFWIGTDGLDPAGTLTFSLSAQLTAKGWTIVGTNPIAAPATPLVFKIRFYKEGSKVFIRQVAA